MRTILLTLLLVLAVSTNVFALEAMGGGGSAVSAPDAASVTNLIPSGGAANVFYVDVAGGNNSNNCLSMAKPCKTITHALTLAPSDVGAVILVTPGAYDESITISKNQINLICAGGLNYGHVGVNCEMYCDTTGPVGAGCDGTQSTCGAGGPNVSNLTITGFYNQVIGFDIRGQGDPTSFSQSCKPNVVVTGGDARFSNMQITSSLEGILIHDDARVTIEDSFIGFEAGAGVHYTTGLAPSIRLWISNTEFLHNGGADLLGTCTGGVTQGLYLQSLYNDRFLDYNKTTYIDESSCSSEFGTIAGHFNSSSSPPTATQVKLGNQSTLFAN